MADRAHWRGWAKGGLIGVVVALGLGVAVHFLTRGWENGTTVFAPEGGVAEAGGEPGHGASQGPAPRPGTGQPPTRSPAAGTVVAQNPALPAFDLVRIEPDGAALVAGRAPPGAWIAVLVDASVLAEVMAGPEGEFVAFFDLPPASASRLMTLRMRVGEDAERLSAEQVVLMPTGPTPSRHPAAAVAAAPDAAPAAVLMGPDGARILQAAEGEAAAEEMPFGIDAISYAAGGEVQLAGRGSPGKHARIYLDNAPLSTFAIGTDGAWGGMLGAVVPGRYVLRADQVDAENRVSARFETPFQREAPEVLAAVLGVEEAEPPGPIPGLADDPGSSPPVVAFSGAPPAMKETAPPGPAGGDPGQDAAAPVTIAPRSGDVLPPAGGARARIAPVSVTVQPGFTLWRIAREQLGDGLLYVKVFDNNRDRIRDPDLIYPGQVFALPEEPQP